MVKKQKSNIVVDILKKWKMTYRELSIEMDVSQTTVYRWKAGINWPQPGHYKKLRRIMEHGPENRN